MMRGSRGLYGLAYGIPTQVEHAWNSWGGGMGMTKYMNV
jgi:hypothetical protein